MSEKDIQNLILLGLGGFAIYMLFLRKSGGVAVAFPVNANVAPQMISVTPQIVGAGVNNPNQSATLTGQTWQTGPGGFPTMSPQGFPATPDDSGNGTNYDYVLTE